MPNSHRFHSNWPISCRDIFHCITGISELDSVVLNGMSIVTIYKLLRCGFRKGRSIKMNIVNFK